MVSFGRRLCVAWLRVTTVLIEFGPLTWLMRQPWFALPLAKACTLAVTSISNQPAPAGIEAVPSPVAATSAEPSAPATCHGVPVAALVQLACVSCQLLSRRLASTTASCPAVLWSERVAEVIEAPSGTGPPSAAKILKRSRVMNRLLS
jgi:hypothetical protein